MSLQENLKNFFYFTNKTLLFFFRLLIKHQYELLYSLVFLSNFLLKHLTLCFSFIFSLDKMLRTRRKQAATKDRLRKFIKSDPIRSKTEPDLINSDPNPIRIRLDLIRSDLNSIRIETDSELI